MTGHIDFGFPSGTVEKVFLGVRKLVRRIPRLWRGAFAIFLNQDVVKLQVFELQGIRTPPKAGCTPVLFFNTPFRVNFLNDL